MEHNTERNTLGGAVIEIATKADLDEVQARLSALEAAVSGTAGKVDAVDQRVAALEMLVGETAEPGPEVDLEPELEPAPTAVEGLHDYFNDAVASPYVLRHKALRDQDQILNVRHRVDGHTAYDPVMDAAKITLPANVANYEQLRTGINVGAEFLGAQQVSALVVWDHYFDQSYQDNHGTTFDGYKSFQLSRHSGNIWFEVRNRFEQQAKAAGGLSYVDVRTYYPVTFASAHTKGGPNAIGPTTGLNYGGDTLGPYENEFLIKANKWTRFFFTVTFTAGSVMATGINLWIADEDRDPVLIVKDVEMSWPANDDVSAGGLLHQWWLEFNSSKSRVGGPIEMYARNFFVLRDVPDVGRWLRRPVGRPVEG